MKHKKITLKQILKLKPRIKKVGEMKISGKSIYKKIKGHEKEINYKIYDLPTNLKNLSVSITVLFSGKINGEPRMTTGHSHKKAEEVYLFLDGKGKMRIGKKSLSVQKNDLVIVPKITWHRLINTGRKELIVLTIFEKTGERERGISKS